MIYEVCWHTTLRKKLLTTEIRRQLRKLIKKKAKKLKIELLKIKIKRKNRVEITFKTKTKLQKRTIQKIIRQMKGYTSFKLRREFPELKQEKTLWTRRGATSSIKRYEINHKTEQTN